MMSDINTDFFSFSNGNTKNADTLFLIDRFFGYTCKQEDTTKGLIPMTKPAASFWIQELLLQPHAEGGYFRETGHSPELIVAEDQRERYLFSNILFLLTADNPSHFHRLKSDEAWYFHEGSTLTIHLLHPDGRYETIKLGRHPEKGELFQFTVPKGVIFGSSIEGSSGDYALVSCMVSPAFDYRDFELLSYDALIKVYPDCGGVLEKLAYKTLPETSFRNDQV